MRGWPNARQQERLRRANRPAAEHDFAAVDRGEGTVALDEQAGGALAVKEYAVDVGVGLDGEVGATASWVEVTDVGAPADALGVVEGQGTDASGGRVVVVGAVGVASGERGLVEGAVLGVELVIFEPPGADGAVGAVIGSVAVVRIGFEATQKGQQGVVAPQVVAGRGPRVVVFGHAAQKNLRVDRTRPADDFATRHKHIGAQVRSPGAILPAKPSAQAKGAIPDIAVAPIRIANLLGQIFNRSKIRPGLQQQDRPTPIFAEPRREHRTRRARSGNDDVIECRHRIL